MSYPNKLLIQCYNSHLSFALSSSDLSIKTEYYARLRGIIACLYHSAIISNTQYNFLAMAFDFLAESPSSDLYSYQELSL